MKSADLEIIREIIETSVQASVKATVNGKIDRMNDKLDAHIKTHEEDWKELKPVVQGITGARIIGNLLKWCGGIALAYLAIRKYL